MFHKISSLCKQMVNKCLTNIFLLQIRVPQQLQHCQEGGQGQPGLGQQLCQSHHRRGQQQHQLNQTVKQKKNITTT